MGEAGARDALALEQNGCVGHEIGKLMHDALDTGEAMELLRDGVAEGNDDVFPHGFKHVHESDGGADGIAIGARVRADQKRLTLVKKAKKGSD